MRGLEEGFRRLDTPNSNSLPDTADQKREHNIQIYVNVSMHVRHGSTRVDSHAHLGSKKIIPTHALPCTAKFRYIRTIDIKNDEKPHSIAKHGNSSLPKLQCANLYVNQINQIEFCIWRKKLED